MGCVKFGDRVRLNYKGWLGDGTVIDESDKDMPLEFTIGKNEVIPGMERALVGMREGDKKEITIPPEGGYGLYSDDLIMEINKDKVSSEIELKTGMRMQAKGDNGNVTFVTVKGVSEKTVILDGNHPLAGKTLYFEIELISIKDC